MSLKKITAVTIASMMISAVPAMTVNAKSYEQKTETVTETRSEERPAEMDQNRGQEQRDPSFRPQDAPEMNGEMPPMGEEMGPRPEDGEVPPEKPEGEFPGGQEGIVTVSADNGMQSQPAMAPFQGQGEEGEVPPEKPEGENDMGMPEGQRMEDGHMAPPMDAEGMNNGMPDMMEEGQGEKPMDGMIPDMEFEDPETQEQANTIISQIKNLFQKLMNLLGNKKDSDSQNQGEKPEDDDERPAMGECTDDGQAPSDSMKERPDGEMSGKPGEMGQMENTPTEFAAANTLTESSTNATYTSSSDSENAVLVSGDTVTVSGSTITKTGNASGDSADFYGTNAAVLANSGANLTLTGVTVETDGSHANGVFSNGSGTTVSISDSTITTSGNNSGGLMVTGGGTITADNLTVTTSGNSSAAIRSDRGGGTANVTSGTYSSSGVGSPAIYSTADINVSNATLSASNSEAVVIEGGNSVTLTNSDITGNNAKLNGQSTVKTNVLIYQSMSGDASEGASSFTMSGGTLTSQTGAMFHVTNVTTTIDLNNVTLNYASDSNVFLDASADAWGTSGKNGGNVTLNLTSQDIVGAILCDSVSKVNVNLDSSSSWTLTGDSYITSFSGDYSKINLNGYKLYINGVLYTA